MDAAERDKSDRPQEANHAEQERRQARAGLALIRARLTHQLEAATSERYRQSLRLALEEINGKIEQLGRE